MMWLIYKFPICFQYPGPGTYGPGEPVDPAKKQLFP